MAAIALPLQQQQQPQQFQQLQAQPQASTAQDPLFEALAKYLTSDPDSNSLSQSQIQTIVTNTVTAKGGREYVASLCSASGTDYKGRYWPDSGITTNGKISTTTANLTFNFGISDIGLVCKGSAEGAFSRGAAALSGGRLFAQNLQQILELACTFKASIINPWNKAPALMIDFYSNETLVACLQVDNTFIRIAPGTGGEAEFHRN